MDTSSIITTKRARYSLHCPRWCEIPVEAHRAEVYEGSVSIDHFGPHFGDFSTWGETRDEDLRVVEAGIDGTAFTVAELRKHSADALAAAAWLEGAMSDGGEL